MYAIYSKPNFWDCLHRMGRFIPSYVKDPELLQLVGNCATLDLLMALKRTSTASRCFRFKNRLEAAKSENEMQHRASGGMHASVSFSSADAVLFTGTSY